MNLKKVLLGVVSAVAIGFVAQSANALTVTPLTNGFLADVDLVSGAGVPDANFDNAATTLTIPNVYQTLVTTNPSETFQTLSFAFTANSDLLAVDTTAINPPNVGTFNNFVLTWSSLIGGGGTVFSSLGSAALEGGASLSTIFALGETKWLTATWDSVDTDPSSFDMRVATHLVPLPAALPLFATALGVMGLLGGGGWRRRRAKQAA